MSYQEFREHVIHQSIEPTGEDRADWHAAMIACQFAQYMWAKGIIKGKQPKLQDFIIDWNEVAKQQTPEARNQMLVAGFKAMAERGLKKKELPPAKPKTKRKGRYQ